MTAPIIVRGFGHRGGSPAVYFHGVPGAAAEARLIERAARADGVELLALERASLVTDAHGRAYADRLADVVRQVAHRRPMLGFSIGAALALRVAARLGADAGPLFLLSPAGPLDVPGAFDGMGTGRRVFRVARRNRPGFHTLARVQALLAGWAPTVLVRAMFAGAGPADRAFAGSADGRGVLTGLVAEAWADGGMGYRRDMLAYVEDWSNELASVVSPVDIWHGAADTWAPPGMARGLGRLLPSARVHLGPEGHYTTLTTHGPAGSVDGRGT